MVDKITVKDIAEGFCTVLLFVVTFSAVECMFGIQSLQEYAKYNHKHTGRLAK